MIPLVIVTVWNRKDETIETVTSLRDTIYPADGNHPSDAVVAIMDNGSTDGVSDWLEKYCDKWNRDGGQVHYTRLDQNIGCPRALNMAILTHRLPGQAVIKIDNDVRLLAYDWIGNVHDMILAYEQQHGPVGTVGAFYDGVLSEQRVRGKVKVNGLDQSDVWLIAPVIGHAIWHTGTLMDRVGYFDVLRHDHLYGFEDNLLQHKADKLGLATLVWPGWEAKNIQRHNSLGDGRVPHIDAMRPLYNQRASAIGKGGPVYCGPDGLPAQSTDSVLVPQKGDN